MSEVDTAGAEVGADDDTPDVGADDAPATPTIEELAAELGHKPLDQWKGDPKDWKDPATFIREGQNNTVIKKLKALERSHDHLLRTSTATTQRLLDEQAAEINARWQQAVDEGDHKAVRQAEKEMRQVEAARNAPDPLVEDFQERNSWYGTDPEATDYAVAVSQRLAAQGKSVSEQLESAEAAVRKRFPEHFGQAPQRQQRQAPTMHTPNSRTSANIKNDPLAGIPREAVQAGREMVAMAQSRGFKNYTIEQWAKTYRNEMGMAN